MIVDLGYGHSAEFPDDVQESEVNDALQHWEPTALDKEVWRRVQRDTEHMEGGPISSEDFAARPLLRKGYVDALAKEYGHGQLAGGLGEELIQQATLGLGPTIAAGIRVLAGMPSATGPGLMSPKTYAEARQPYDAPREAWQEANPLLSAASTLASIPTTSGGLKVGGALLSRLPGGQFLAGQSPGLLKAPSLVAGGGTLGAFGGVLQSQLNPEQSVLSQAATGGEVGAALAPVTPLLRSLLDYGIHPEVARVAADADRLGVHFTPGQLAPKPSPVSEEKALEQVKGYNKALNRTIGSSADDFTQASFEKARDDIGQRLEAVVPRLNLYPHDAVLGHDLAQIDTEAATAFGANYADAPGYRKFASRLQQIQADLAQAAGGTGFVPGSRIQQLTKKDGSLDQLIKDPETRYFGIRLRSALEDSLTRNPANAPEDVAEYGLARQHWRTMTALDGVVGKGGPAGYVDPTLINGALDRAYRGYAWGDVPDDLQTLGKAGMLLPKPTATGGTKQSGGHGGVVLPGVLGNIAEKGAALGLAYEALPMLQHHPIEASALLAGGGALLFGKRVKAGVTQSEVYARSAIDRALHPERYRGPNPLLTATGVATLKGPEQPLDLTQDR